MAATHDKEKQLTREIAPKVESALPGTEVLAVELTSPERFTVFVDHVQGDSIKLTKNDSADGKHHLIPQSWVDHVDTHVHLKKNSAETEREWLAV